MTLTSAMLLSKNACASQVEKFEREWPNGMPLDESVVPRIVEIVLDVDWFARNFLTAPAWAEYKRVRDSALAEYKRVTVPAQAEYERVRDSALAEYERVTVPAQAEYERVRDSALAEYERVTDSAWSEYRRVTDSAWSEYERVRALTALRLYAQEAQS